MNNKIYIKITEATDCEGRKPYKFFAEAVIPKQFVTIETHKNIYGEHIYWVHLNKLGEQWFLETYHENWNPYFSLMDTKYNPKNPLEQYYEELKKAEDHLAQLKSLI